jgi:hypothetical protein
MAPRHWHNMIRRLLLPVPVCRRALSIRSVMAFLDGSKGRGQAPRRDDKARVTMYVQYWTLGEQSYTAAMVLEGFDTSRMP